MSMIDQLPESIQHDLNAALPLIVANAINVVAAIAILLIGIWLAGRVRAMVLRALGRTPNVDDMLRGFFGSLAQYSVLTLTILSVLAQFGIQTTSLVAVLGATGLAVGLALQGTLSNVAAGVMLLLFRPFRLGQSVDVGGIAGTVKELGLFTTELVTADNVQMIVPNASIWGHPVKNFSIYSDGVLTLRFRIAYGADRERAIACVAEAIGADPRSRKTPAPAINLDHNPDGTIAVLAAIWRANGDNDGLKTDLIKSVKTRFDAAGIAIPPPP